MPVYRERLTYPDPSADTVREHLRDVHGDEDWDTDVDPMGLHQMLHLGENWLQGHLHPTYPFRPDELPEGEN